MTTYKPSRQGMISGQGEAQIRRYHKYIGKSGNTWLVADQPNKADNVYVTNNPQNSGGEGFAGAHLTMPLTDGTNFILKGGWHSNSEALFNDTGVDVRDTAKTFVVLAKERGEGFWGELKDIVYIDKEPTLGRYERYKDLMTKYPEANYYHMESSGGSSSGPCR